MFNISLRTGSFPTLWKSATITPIPKVKVVSKLGELRPISLTPVLGKILEGLVADQLLADIRANLDPKQYGNLKGKSTTHYLVDLLDFVLKGLEEKNTMALILLVDFQKAFDYIDHTVAVTQLFHLGCRPSILRFVGDFLSHRRHRVAYQDALSEYDEITCGVPQGTRLGVLVFLAVVDMLCRDDETRVKYVDDLAMAEIINIRNQILFAMQGKLNSLSRECKHLNMITNPIKCEALYPCPTQLKRPITYPDLQLNNVPLPIAHEVKLLGVYIDNTISWQTHVNYILKRANRMIFILYRARQFGFAVSTMLTLYQWYIRTGLEYAAPVWHPGLTVQQQTSLERVQKRCYRIMLGDAYISYENAIATLQTASLYDRREALTLRFGKSLLRSPEFRRLLPPTGDAVHQHRTRHRHLLRPIRGSARYKKTTIPYIVDLLNREQIS